ncbi:unnamed protein product, partial [Ectocarpus sp. 8 AP-2014]
RRHLDDRLHGEHQGSAGGTTLGLAGAIPWDGGDRGSVLRLQGVEPRGDKRGRSQVFRHHLRCGEALVVSVACPDGVHGVRRGAAFPRA